MVPTLLVLTVLAAFFCCANGDIECQTPEGQPGKCVSIYSCPHLMTSLQPPPPVPVESTSYILKSLCHSPKMHSVCCGPPPLFQSEEACERTVSEFTPDPRSRCCGVSAADGNKILGGNMTMLDQYPWLVNIEYTQKNNTKLLCGGALISGLYVLTAASCVTGNILQIGTPTNVRLGEHDLNNAKDCSIYDAEDCTDGITVIPIKRITPHPDHNPSKWPSPHDIALIELNNQAPFTDFIRPICLPFAQVTVTTDNYKYGIVAGWGATSLGTYSQVKEHSEVPLVDNNECTRAYGGNITLSDTQLCTGGVNEKNSCRGDHGGPLMYENGPIYDVIGVKSFGSTPCTRPNELTVYTNVHNYIDWIGKTINEHGFPSPRP